MRARAWDHKILTVIVIVTYGRTQSGKSTTLAKLLKRAQAAPCVGNGDGESVTAKPTLLHTGRSDHTAVNITLPTRPCSLRGQFPSTVRPITAPERKEGPLEWKSDVWEESWVEACDELREDCDKLQSKNVLAGSDTKSTYLSVESNTLSLSI